MDFNDRRDPEFHEIGSLDHPLGRRRLWLNRDGSGRMLTEEKGGRSSQQFNFGAGQGHQALMGIKGLFNQTERGA